MTTRTHGTRQSLVFPSAVICAMILVGACLFSATVLSAEQGSGGITEKEVEKATEKMEEAVGEAVEEAVEKAAEKAAEKTAEKEEEKAKRPEEGKGATKVHFAIFVVDIDAIDDASQNFTGNVYMRLRWKDKRLADPEGSIRQIPLDEVWNPRVLLANQTGIVSKTLPEVVQVSPDGSVIYFQRYTGKLSQALKLSEFPFDKHTFTIQFASVGFYTDDLEFVPDDLRGVRGGTIADELSLPDWRIVKYEALTLPYHPHELIISPGFAFRFEAERYVAYYIWQVVLPLAIVVGMSWAAFWVKREHVGVRIGVATSSILTLIAHRFVLANLLPRLPYMTRMDYFTVGSTLLVFLALIAVVSTGFLSDRNKQKARIIDIWARGGFPAMFLALLGWFAFG